MDATWFTFEYLYRDAGNFKTFGAILLSGDGDEGREFIRACLEVEDLFVAEQVGVPSLCGEHWNDCGADPSDLDHAYHEFVDLRPATEEEQVLLPVVGSLEDLLARFRVAAGRWDVSLSPNCNL